ncbi:hypothetical protein P879_04672 [Paragonimus westermani]|uniref:Uncharacterized protein n=1 Tax=Paragonimus westermani TaxID=34504 RepID=A0A8T0DCN7_9TREM|nr:hypothetical protein P879_04672 [Paragonimus westermani]
MSLNLLTVRDFHAVITGGDFVFAVGKIVRSNATSSLLENKIYGYGLDDELLFDQLVLTCPMANPMWIRSPQMTKPYMDDGAILVVELFKIPLNFSTDGKVFISTPGSWFDVKTEEPKRSGRLTRSHLGEQHLVGWSAMKLFDWGFVRAGLHELVVLKPPVRRSWLNVIQEQSESVLLLNNVTIQPELGLSVYLKDGNLLGQTQNLGEELELLKTYSQITKFQKRQTTPEDTPADNDIHVEASSVQLLGEYRRHCDKQWYPEDLDGQTVGDKLLGEIHQLLTKELDACESRVSYKPLFMRNT